MINRHTSSIKYLVISILFPSFFIVSCDASAASYSIIYDDNVVSSMPTDVSDKTYGTTVSVSSITPVRSGYNYLGWCSVIPTYINGADTCTGSTQYSAGSDLTINQTGANNNFHLYAMWEEDPCHKNPDQLYCIIADMSKGKQTSANLKQTITVPTSVNQFEDTSNSGVYEYDPTVFGESSDMSNNYKIYYYRGVLENNPGTYGSDGSAVTYPNYVILDADNNKTTTDTCWRITRTTGSGGVKMIYNGTWTGSTCANTTSNAQIAAKTFGLKGNSSQFNSWHRNINRVGYTFNNDTTIQDTDVATSVEIVFGSDLDPSLNNARSNVKTYIEDTWYTNNMTNFTNILEASAGYCNDRTAFSGGNISSALSTIPPYATRDAQMYFGAYVRNMDTTKTPSLTCPRSIVDLYRYVANSSGLSNELKYPAALLTADEAIFAGSGNSNYNSSYNANSFLNSGSGFWLLSPGYRQPGGYACEYNVSQDGYFVSSYSIDNTQSVRPAISLVSGTSPTSGTGTATDPWVVTAP